MWCDYMCSQSFNNAEWLSSDITSWRLKCYLIHHHISGCNANTKSSVGSSDSYVRLLPLRVSPSASKQSGEPPRWNTQGERSPCISDPRLAASFSDCGTRDWKILCSGPLRALYLYTSIKCVIVFISELEWTYLSVFDQKTDLKLLNVEIHI